MQVNKPLTGLLPKPSAKRRPCRLTLGNIMIHNISLSLADSYLLLPTERSLSTMPAEAWPEWREFYQLWDTPRAQRLLAQPMQGSSSSSGALRKLLKATKQLLPECPVERPMPADVLEAAITWKAMEVLVQLADILSPLKRHALPDWGALLSSVWSNSLAALVALSGSMSTGTMDHQRLGIQQLTASPGIYQTRA